MDTTADVQITQGRSKVKDGLVVLIGSSSEKKTQVTLSRPIGISNIPKNGYVFTSSSEVSSFVEAAESNPFQRMADQGFLKIHDQFILDNSNGLLTKGEDGVTMCHQDPLTVLLKKAKKAQGDYIDELIAEFEALEKADGRTLKQGEKPPKGKKLKRMHAFDKQKAYVENPVYQFFENPALAQAYIKAEDAWKNSEQRLQATQAKQIMLNRAETKGGPRRERPQVEMEWARRIPADQLQTYILKLIADPVDTIRLVTQNFPGGGTENAPNDN
jgi:hypothetical protein